MNETGQAIRPAPSVFFFLLFLLIIMFRTLDQLIKHHGDGAQDNDGSDDHIELEEMQNVGERDRHGSLLV